MSPAMPHPTTPDTTPSRYGATAAGRADRDTRQVHRHLDPTTGALSRQSPCHVVGSRGGRMQGRPKTSPNPHPL